MASDGLANDLRDTLAVFETASDPWEPLSTTDVAERLDLSQERSATRLEMLADRGFLKTKTVGTQDQVWWHPPEPDAETEYSFSGVVANVPGMIYRCRNEEDWPMAFVSDGCRQLTGYDPEALAAGRIRFGEDIIHPDDVEHVWDTVQEGLDDDGWFTIQYRIRTADEDTRWVWERGRAVSDTSEGPQRLEGLITDITELKTQAQHLKREIDEVFERVDDAFYALDTDFRFTYVNDRAEELLQHTEEDLLGESVWEMFPEATETPAWESFHKALDNQEPTSYDLYYDPLEFWVEATVYPSETGLSVYFRDVTDRKERDRKLREERDRFNALFESVPEAVVHVSFEGDEPIIRNVNREFEDAFGYPREELIGASLNEYIIPERLLDEATWVDETIPPEDRIEREVRGKTADGDREFLFRGVPFPAESETIEGVGVYVDITEQKEREQKLEEHRNQLETLFEVLPVGVVVAAADGALVEANDVAEELWGGDVFDAESVADYERYRGWWADTGERVDPDEWTMARVLDGTEVTDPDVFEIETADGEHRTIMVHGMPVRDASGDVTRGVVTQTDITERRNYRRQLEEAKQRYQTLVENLPNGAVTLVDEDLRYTTVGGEPLESTIDDLKGRPLEEALSSDLADVLVPRYRAALDGEASSFEHTVDDRTYRFRILPVRTDDGGVVAALGMSQDITEQKEREQYLRDAKIQLEAATEAGAVGTWEWDIPDDRMVTGASFARLFGVDPEAAREGVSVDEFVSAIHEDDSDRVERAVDDAIESCGEYREEYRVWDPNDDLRWVIARGHVECDQDGTPVTFPGALVDITERKERERELERQREQLSALNDINTVVRGITDAIIERSTREEVERVVCEQLAASDSYEFAWVGEVEPHGDAARVSTEAGSEGYVDGLEISIAPDDPTSQGPTGRAFRTGEMQVVRDVFEDPAYDPWRDRAAEYGFRSSAAIPIAYEGTRYGVLNVYAARPHAYDESEREVIGQLGEVVGHAINAIERKRALMSNEIVQLEFMAHGVFDDFGVSEPDEGRITFDRAIPLGGEEFLVYGKTTGDAFKALAAIADRRPQFEEPTVVTETSDEIRYKVRLDGPPILSAVAANGGRLQTAVMEAGDFRLTVEVPPGINVRRITEAVQDIYPTAEVVAQRQISREDWALLLREALTEEVTDRQRTALESAFYAGFFEWPRENTGEDVAASMDIAPATFHEHLRAGQKKLLGALFGEGPALG